MSQPSQKLDAAATTKRKRARTDNSLRESSVARGGLKDIRGRSDDNVVDTLLAEAHDILGAAAEAQAMGRLKMANKYLLLLHARLVGLGKRFDRSMITIPRSKVNENDINDPGNATENSSRIKEGRRETVAPEPSVSTSSAPLMRKLANFIPKDVQLDESMMEHLARAAVELHKKRKTGDKDTVKERERQAKDSATGIAWTNDEHQRCIAAANRYGPDDTKEIAKAVGTRTEAQVRAHLRNASERKRATMSLKVDSEIWDELSGGSKASGDNVGKAEKCNKEASCSKARERR